MRTSGPTSPISTMPGALRAAPRWPLLIVSDMVRFQIRTNWTNSVSRTHEFELDDLADASTRDRLKWAFSDPDRLRPRGDPAVAHRARSGVVRVGCSGAARARARSAGGRTLRQPARVLHVRRRRRPASGPHVHADAAACAACSGAVHRTGRRSVRGDGHRGPGGLRDGGLVQRRPVRRRRGAAAGEVRHRDSAGGVGPGLVGDRPVDPRGAVRARPRSRQARAARGALTRPGQDHAAGRAGGDPSVAGRVGSREGRDRGRTGTCGSRQVQRRADETAERGRAPSAGIS